MQIDFSGLAKKSLEQTDEFIRQFGPRLTGSDSCQKVAEKIALSLSEFCDKTKIEDFNVHPDSFSFYIKILPIMFFLSLFLLYLKSYWVILSLIGLLFGIIMMVIIFGFYKHTFDGFFPKKNGKNIYGTIEPLHDVRQQIILSGHHDSAREIRILASPFQKLYAPVILIPYLFYLFTIFVIIISLLGNFQITSSPIILGVFIIGIPFVLYYFFILSRKGTPGAGDNLIASVMIVELGNYLASLKQTNSKFLKHTRVILISFDSEEAGLRGSAAFMKEHYEDLHKIPTYHLNFDSLYNFDEFHILTDDINGLIPLSHEMVEELIEIGTQNNISLHKFKMIFGGGATDAAESARIGIPATTIIAMPTNIIREGLVYHTRNDTVEFIDPSVVEGCLKITWDYLLQKDNEIEKKSSGFSKS
ncbi:M28 family metallopeptidase [Promethearchaeum syntrophicum]|uniref:M28 family metallopeptidase n=1 Tax=Promethearchaeum syntrophicum TaxID=2594042 RepID=A0A5B9DEF9_9ARCH|nr:M28 family peptidase [Candidatus Prometheoarchaeum syntrophicum]QEE17699.1 Peptidase family M28 [Candidatus Prometheoarchaeum syntrophicum]